MQRRLMRAKMRKRIRIGKNGILKMTTIMVYVQVSKVDSIIVLCEEDLFRYESYTYLSWEDFEVVLQWTS